MGRSLECDRVAAATGHRLRDLGLCVTSNLRSTSTIAVDLAPYGGQRRHVTKTLTCGTLPYSTDFVYFAHSIGAGGSAGGRLHPFCSPAQFG